MTQIEKKMAAQFAPDPNSIEMPAEFVQSASEIEAANNQETFGTPAESVNMVPASTIHLYDTNMIVNNKRKRYALSPERQNNQPLLQHTHQVPPPEFRPPSSYNSPQQQHQQSSHTSRTEEQHNSRVVASHYNNLSEKGLQERAKSRIFYMRNFNNWIKSVLINEYMTKVKETLTYGAAVRVLDMCCGKGGDLLKWDKSNITHLICTDIADVSIQQCEERYKSMVERNRKKFPPMFTAEFIASDNTNGRLREHYKDPSIELNLVSCQFAFHYCFESLRQAECMIKNAAECLKTGGYFIGTIPDANDIMKRQHAAKAKKFGNSVYEIAFLCDTEYPPLFGAKYNFMLDGVVNCPEFLVHFPLLVKLARKFGLELVMKERFEDYFDRMVGPCNAGFVSDKKNEFSLILKKSFLHTHSKRFAGANARFGSVFTVRRR